MSYSIYSSVVNGYEPPRPCADADAAGRLMFTDGEAGEGWTRVPVEGSRENPFDTVFGIRWDPFGHTGEPGFAVWLDGSFEVTGSLGDCVDRVDSGGYDVGMLVHPWRDNVFDEYVEWVRTRNYPADRARRWMDRMEARGFDVTAGGLYSTGMMVFRDCGKVRDFCAEVWKELHALDGSTERLDQTVATSVLAGMGLKVLGIDCSVYGDGGPLRWLPAHPAI